MLYLLLEGETRKGEDMTNYMILENTNGDLAAIDLTRGFTGDDSVDIDLEIEEVLLNMGRDIYDAVDPSALYDFSEEVPYQADELETAEDIRMFLNPPMEA